MTHSRDSATVLANCEAAESLTARDWDIPCGYSLHSLIGTGSAAWAVWYRPLHPCGCRGGEFRYFCDPCWRARSQSKTYCPKCGAAGFAPMESIARIEAVN